MIRRKTAMQAGTGLALWAAAWLLVWAVPIGAQAADPAAGPAWQGGDRALEAGRFDQARNLYLEALARAGREGRRPGFLLYKLARVQEALGHREAAWLLCREALTRPWGGPADEASRRAEARRKLHELVPGTVAMPPLVRASDAYQEQLQSWLRHKDPLVRLVAVERLAWLDPGRSEIREAAATNLGQWLKEELAWQLERPSRIPIRSSLKEWTWRNGQPEVVGGNRIRLEAAAGESVILLVPTETRGGFSFTVQLRVPEKGKPRSWGFVFGDHPDGESRDVVSVHRGILTWSRYQTGTDWRTIGVGGLDGAGAQADPHLLSPEWNEFTLHLEPLSNRIRIFAGDRVVLDLPGKRQVPDGRLGVFSESGILQVRKASLAMAASVE